MLDIAWQAPQEVALERDGKTHVAQYAVMDGAVVVMKTSSGTQSALVGSLEPETVARALLAELAEQGRL